MKYIYIFVLITLLIDQLSHSLCDESSVIIFTLSRLTNANETSSFSLYRSLTSLTGCIGSWISGVCIDRWNDIAKPLISNIRYYTELWFYVFI